MQHSKKWTAIVLRHTRTTNLDRQRFQCSSQNSLSRGSVNETKNETVHQLVIAKPHNKNHG